MVRVTALVPLPQVNLTNELFFVIRPDKSLQLFVGTTDDLPKLTQRNQWDGVLLFQT